MLENARAPQPRRNYSGAGSGGTCHDGPLGACPIAGKIAGQQQNVLLTSAATTANHWGLL